MSVGIGYDVHRLVPDRRLVLGGIVIPHPWGLFGHSDADVLTHAVIDALLGAAGLGDIGRHFPDDDARYADCCSLVLLATVCQLIADKGLAIHNVDATVIADKPRLAEYIPAMQQALAEAMGIECERVNIKATTNEGLGYLGQGQGIAALAVCQLDG